MDIWAKPQPRPRKQAAQHVLTGKVKDWPEPARAAFKHTKNELWKWAKQKEGRDRSNLALIAYQAVQEAFAGTTVKATVYDDVIICNNMEEVWSKMLSLKSQR